MAEAGDPEKNPLGDGAWKGKPKETGEAVRDPRPEPVRGTGDVDRDNWELIVFGGDSSEGGEEVRGGVGVEEPEVSDFALPMLTSETDVSS